MNTQNYVVNIRVGLANPARVNISQGDTGRTLAFSLYDGLSPFTPPTGSTVTIVGRKPSKLGFSEACTVSGNVATVTTTLAMTQEAGKFPVELRIEANGESIGTANFTMYIEPSPHPDGTTDGTHATVDNLQTQIGNLANLTTTAKTNLVSAINEAAQSGGTEVVIDNTLTHTGQAADAKKTGDEISAIKADLANNVNVLKSALENAVYPVLEDLGYGISILTTEDFTYGAYLSAAGRRTDGAYGYLKSADELLPVEDITIILTADDVGTTNYIRTIALYNDGVFRTNYDTNTPFENGVANISASDIQARFPGANGMRINVGALDGSSFVMFPASTGITVASAESVPITTRVSALESSLLNKKYYIVDQNGNGDYISLYVAVNALPENSLIFVKPGEYLIPNSRYLSLRDKGMFIIGEDRDSCIITSYDGRYEYPAVWANSGLLENLTIRSVYLSGASNEIDANTNGAYAVHFDQESSVGKTLTIRNCKMISDFNCGIGIGLRKDATLNIEDCFIHANQITGRGKYNYGALLVHDSIGVQGAQYFNLINCTLLSNLGVAMTINNSRGGDNVVYCKMLNNTLKDAQNGYANNVVLGNSPFTSVFVKSLCYGNSNSELNEA